MNEELNRRQFLGRSAGTALALTAGVPALAAPEDRPKKSVMFSMLPKLNPDEKLNMEAKFKLAKEVGFEGVEIHPITEEKEAMALRAAAERAGIPIQSIIYGGWDSPLSEANPEVVERGKKSIRAALQSAKWMGADNILLVPAVVTPTTSYRQAYERSQKHIRELIPDAERLHVMICIEEVWNKFLLSPLEFAQYIDSFNHPLVQAYFDVGNVVLYGYPQDWIRTLGKRIKKVHLKDFKRNNYQWVNLRDGDIDWPEVRRAFAEVGFTGFMNTELGGGDEAYLRDVSARVDKILAGV